MALTGGKKADMLLRGMPVAVKKALKIEAAKEDKTMTELAAEILGKALIKKGG